MKSSLETDLEQGFAAENKANQPSQDTDDHEDNCSLRASIDMPMSRTSDFDEITCIHQNTKVNQVTATPTHSLKDIVSRNGSETWQDEPRDNSLVMKPDDTAAGRKSSIGSGTVSVHSGTRPIRQSRDGFAPRLTSHSENSSSDWVVEHHGENLFQTIVKKEPNSWFDLQKVIDSARQSLTKDRVKKSNGSPRIDEDHSFRISLAELQRMYLRKVQVKLAKHIVAMRFDKIEPDGWEEDLQAYVKGLQDYDYMVKCSQLLRDPFLITGERKIDDLVIEKALEGRAVGDIGKPIPVVGPWEQTNEPINGTRNEHVAKSRMQEFKRNLFMASIGGILLIAPMWLMVLHNTLYTSLVSTTVFVALFGSIMAWYMKEPKEVMSGTAAYAAVLVVFVGLNTET